MIAALEQLTHRLSDWGYGVSTGPLVWNRYKQQLAASPGPRRYPLIWAEAVAADGQFRWRSEKRNHSPYFEVRHGDERLMTNSACVLVQRTTAKEQSRRLISACLPMKFIERHEAVVVENHLNMVRPLDERPPVPPMAVAALLNSAAADDAFRCISGSVAVSAYELEALPLPAPGDLSVLSGLIEENAGFGQIHAECDRLFKYER